MPKAEAGTPKWLANKMKSKGLQKLRWYCQMCEKQCRDENGFKCHISSESHQRQLLLFAENPNRYLDDFSSDFKNGYVELLRRRYGTKRVNANQIYQEYISHKDHLHMNATKWLTLTEFVKWLGREGICTVDETEKGWFVTWIDRDPETIARQQQLAKKSKMDKDDNERMLEFIDKQVERAGKASKASSSSSEYSDFVRNNEEEKVQLKLNTASVAKPTATVVANPSVFKVPYTSSSNGASSVKSYGSSSSSSSHKRKVSALEEIKEEQERFKERKYKKASWLTENIIVKVVTRECGDKYYKQKGVILKIIDDFVCIVELIESGHRLKLDQNHLETVIPNLGNIVKVVNGEHRGSEGRLKSVDFDRFCVAVELTSGTYKGTVVKNLPYESVCKYNHNPSE